MGRTRGTNDVGGKDRADIATIGLGDDTNAHGIETTGATTTTEPLAGVDGVLHGGMPAAASPYLGLGHDVHDAAAYRRMAPLSANAHAGGSNSNSGANVPPRFPPFSESYVDMSELRRELKVLSVRNNMPYYMHHSSPQRLEARCPTWKNRKEVPTSCEFVVAANRHTNGRVYVTRAHTEHSPSCPSIQNTTNYVSAAALMETAKPFMLKIADSVKPRDMANIMKEKFGVATSYMTAWRALTAFKQEKKHEETASFTKIGGYLHAFAKANEGTVVAFEHLAGSNNVFSRAFLCPKPLQQAILSCRAQLLLSVFLITSTNGGVVMTATAQDAMGDTVPVAIGIALTETEENWRFFLEKLREAIPDLENSITTLVYNRGPVLQQAAAAVFPKCVQSDAVDLFLAPSQTTMASALGTAPIPTNSLQWIEALCAKTPLMILVGWVSKVASTLFQRYEKYGKMSSEYPEEFHALLTQYETDAKDYDVVRISEHGYEVIDKHSGRQRIVDFAKRTCTCGEYEASRFPCLHVFLALSFAGMMRADVIPPIFLMKTLQALYVGRITPIDVGTVDSDGTTVPNPLPKARGRPRKIQQIQQVSDVKHDKLACSICGVKGHNKRTCKRLTSGNPAGLLAIDSEDQPFLGTYGDGMFNGVLASDQGHAPVVEGDGSPSAKRRRLGQAKTEDDENATTIV